MLIRNLLRRKLRTLFSVAGVGVGISLMVALFTMSSDFLRQLTDILTGARGDVLVFQAGRDVWDSQIPLSTPEGGGRLDELLNDPRVAAAHPLIFSWIRTERRVGASSQLDFYGVTPDSPVIRSFEPIAHAAPGEPLISDEEPDGFIVGSRLLELANAQLPPDRQLKVGDRVNLLRLLTVDLAGFFVDDPREFETMTQEERTRMAAEKLQASRVDPRAVLAMQDLYLRAVVKAPQAVQDIAIYFHHDRAQALRSMAGQTSLILLELNDDSDASKDAFAADMNRRSPDLRFVRSDQVLDDYGEVELIRQFSLGVSLIAALAGAFGVLNIMLLSVMERTREIGLLLAIGWSKARVMRSVIVEGTVITLLGGLLGIVLGYAEMVLLYEVFNIRVVTPRFDPTVIAQVLCLSLALGIAASIYPAWRASRLSPMDALRTE